MKSNELKWSDQGGGVANSQLKIFLGRLENNGQIKIAQNSVEKGAEHEWDHTKKSQHIFKLNL